MKKFLAGISILGLLAVLVAPTYAEEISTIISPDENEKITGDVLQLEAYYADKDDDGYYGVSWAVRLGTCDRNTGTVAGNVDGHHDVATWDGKNFYYEEDISDWEDGEYCFVFNPAEDSTRLTRWFEIVNPVATQTQSKSGEDKQYQNSYSEPARNGGLVGEPNAEPSVQCTTIQDQILEDSDGILIPLGFDFWGYNYQGRFFEGGLCDAYHDAPWCQEWSEDHLVMKWNDAWLSNQDCDDDGKLDRHYPYPSYIGSGAWETNTQNGSYLNDEGETCHWSYFTKIVAAPEGAEQDEQNNWVLGDTVIGPVIWNQFAVIQEEYTDSCLNSTEGHYKSVSELPIGFGFWDNNGN